MHQAVLDKIGLNHTYGALLINSNQDLELFFDMLKISSVKGVNVTVPYKESVIKYLDTLDHSAQNCQAVNTIVNNNGHLTGYNTDGRGLVYSLQQDVGVDLLNKHVLILGAGGAAKGIAYELCNHNLSSLTILNRTKEKADTLQYGLESHYKLPIYTGSLTIDESTIEWERLHSADIIIQTTSIGLMGTPGSPLSNVSWARSSQLVVDIIYKPYATQFLMDCSNLGLKTVNGVGMLAGQGALAFELFTDYEADYLLMRDIVEKTAKDVI